MPAVAGHVKVLFVHTPPELGVSPGQPSHAALHLLIDIIISTIMNQCHMESQVGHPVLPRCHIIPQAFLVQLLQFVNLTLVKVFGPALEDSTFQILAEFQHFPDIIYGQPGYFVAIPGYVPEHLVLT